ncbi:transglutaminaseTgpA domain-containing protein [Shewanella alkalitolerans]|uniref:transglutaminase family protein n=1 Tax=Shewanella alkalitolerans TaxID=2864209 RepID=UPI001C65CF56|nr:transglutaminaseTgpA domain-containing protein [Shewanella alkalitolerans]QYJ96076.1 transglutaminaseTgpA domain-containing protein [Shewanella alkalitolerans]
MADSKSENIGRQSLLWLLLVNLSVLAPLYDKMTPWSMAICAICLLWRVGIFAGKVAKPPRYLVTTLAIASAVTLALVTAQIGLLNGLINLLILGYALKYIEMRDRRDVRAVVLVGFFLIAVTLIEKQSLWFTLQLTLVATINICVLVSLYLNAGSIRRTAKLGAKIMLQSLPLAIVLFMVLPRLPPLWLVPNPKNATTGLSDELSFGDIGKLTRSSALAYRVTFDNRRPANNQLYWRALVLDHYDGKTWSQDPGIKTLQRQLTVSNARPSPEGTSINYEVIAEPSYQNWLFGLDLAYTNTREILELPDGRLYAKAPLSQKYQYRVSSYPQAKLDPRLSPELRRRNLQLPPNTNPRSQALGLELKRDYPNPERRLKAIMTLFNESPYFYTLEPPRVGPQQIDDFLFENRAGFCAHYASAMVFLARQSGLPARMVTGYQGGEWNQAGDYLSVYQYMAHAWVEVWLEGKGWTRYDPTAMIAPERVEAGFDAMFSPEQSYLINNPFSSLRLRQYPLLNNLRMSLASIDYYWSKWVLGFDEERQSQLLKELLGEINATKLAIFIIASFSVIALFIAYSVGLLRFTRHPDPVVAGFEQIGAMLAKRGLPRAQGESVDAYQTRVLAAAPELSEPMTRYTTSYMTLKYRAPSLKASKQLKRQLKQDLRRLRLAILKLKGRLDTSETTD